MSHIGRDPDVGDRWSIRVDTIACSAIIGTLSHERTQVQPVVVDVAMQLADAPNRAAIDDAFAHTIDYAAVATEVRFIVETLRPELMESLVHTIATWLVHRPSTLQPQRVVVTARKPLALDGPVPLVSLARAAPSAPMVLPDHEPALIGSSREMNLFWCGPKTRLTTSVASLPVGVGTLAVQRREVTS